MASLYERVAARGFPVSASEGLSGEGALDSQGHPVDPAHGQNVFGQNPQTLTGFQSEGPPPPEVTVLEGFWGLPGSISNPDQTPRTHAAPTPGWAGSYEDPALLEMHRASVEIHSVDFGALERRTQINGLAQGGDALDASRWTANDAELNGPNPQVPLTGAQRVLGGRDAVQGYDLRNRYGFDAGHKDRTQIHGNVPNAYLNPAERVLVTAQAGQFFATDAVQGPDPTAPSFNAPSINATAQTDYAATPPAPDTSSSPPVGAPASSGWW